MAARLDRSRHRCSGYGLGQWRWVGDPHCGHVPKVGFGFGGRRLPDHPSLDAVALDSFAEEGHPPQTQLVVIRTTFGPLACEAQEAVQTQLPLKGTEPETLKTLKRNRTRNEKQGVRTSEYRFHSIQSNGPCLSKVPWHDFRHKALLIEY